ncbi:hypothetical protein [Massilia sp. X63]|jgi:hypothetical protein
MNQPKQQQEVPGHESALSPQADHGESSYISGARIAVTGGTPTL